MFACLQCKLCVDYKNILSALKIRPKLKLRFYSHNAVSGVESTASIAIGPHENDDIIA